MKTRAIFIALAAVCLAGGTAFAKSSALDQEDTMRTFYQDKDMKHMKTGDEFTAAVKALSPERLKMVSQACHEDANGERTHTDFCAALDSASGAKTGHPDTGANSNTDSNSN